MNNNSKFSIFLYPSYPRPLSQCAPWVGHTGTVDMGHNIRYRAEIVHGVKSLMCWPCTQQHWWSVYRLLNTWVTYLRSYTRYLKNVPVCPGFPYAWTEFFGLQHALVYKQTRFWQIKQFSCNSDHCHVNQEQWFNFIPLDNDMKLPSTPSRYCLKLNNTEPSVYSWDGFEQHTLKHTYKRRRRTHYPSQHKCVIFVAFQVINHLKLHIIQGPSTFKEIKILSQQSNYEMSNLEEFQNYFEKFFN